MNTEQKTYFVTSNKPVAEEVIQVAPTVIDLQDAGEYDESIVGGKAKNLGKLAAGGFPVPPGFCIPTTTPIEEIIHHAVGEYRERSMQNVAVRSSANVEDQMEYGGYRGIFETQYLADPTQEVLGQTVQKVRASGETERARAYRQAHGIENVFRVAVIVQTLINASKSGVMMVGNSEDEVYIEAVDGMGELLVEGTKTPSAYVVQKGEVSERRRNGGNLSEEQLHALSQIGRSIVQDLFPGEAQEVEFCFDQQDQLFILQSRPLPHEVMNRLEGISTEDTIGYMIQYVEKLAERSSLGEVILSDSNIAENLGVRPALISTDIFGYIFAGNEGLSLPGAIQIGRNEMGYDCDHQSYGLWGIDTMIGGKPYFDLVKDALTFRMKGFSIEDYQILIDSYVEQVKQNPRKAQYPEAGLYKQVFTGDELVKFFGPEKGAEYALVQEEFLSNIRYLEADFAQSYLQREQEIDSYVMGSTITSEQSSNEHLVGSFNQHLEMLRTTICVDFVKAARLGFFAYDRVRSYLEQHHVTLGIPEHQVDEVTLQLTSNPYGEPYGNPQTEKALMFSAIRQGKATMEDFLAEFGHEGVTELDIKRPRFRDNFKMIEGYIESADLTLKERINDQETERRLRLEQITVALEERGVDGIEPFISDIETARLYLVFREKIKYNYLKVYQHLREILVTLGERYAFGDEIFDLSIQEINGLLDQEEQVRENVEKRKRFLFTARGMYKPATIFSSEASHNLRTGVEQSSTVLEVSKVLGSSVVTGVVKKVIDPYGVKLERENDTPIVVVTEATDPGWTTFLSGLTKGDALVTEIGGALSHEAVAAAGFGFTVACGVDGATIILQDGQVVQIDPMSNTLTIIKDGEEVRRKL